MKILLLLAAVSVSAGNAAQPSAVTLGPGQTQQFSASCNSRRCVYDWGIDTQWCGSGGVAAGAIDKQTGLYTAPTTIATRQTVFIAISINGSFNCGAVVTLQPPPTLAVGCPCHDQPAPIWDEHYLWLCAGGRWGRILIQFQ